MRRDNKRTFAILCYWLSVWSVAPSPQRSFKAGTDNSLSRLLQRRLDCFPWSRNNQRKGRTKGGGLFIQPVYNGDKVRRWKRCLLAILSSPERFRTNRIVTWKRDLWEADPDAWSTRRYCLSLCLLSFGMLRCPTTPPKKKQKQNKQSIFKQ